MDDNYFLLRMFTILAAVLISLMVAILTYNITQSFNDAKVRIETANIEHQLQKDRLEHGYTTLYDPVTHQDVVVREQCK